ncbi:glycerol-3-phosphate dehydrogenase/oxidase [Rhodopirellula sp. JC740]|uniref:Glycerol-3-phosphate dehydrogenase/oxidase n=1 Tax=Rhodopirellula halodulae TaxID=2894198 RepID=A0ABS8NNE2_9BACT|nr:glycerol-3-phosphate dehydrogenase/oxidase [Rhodopirellula sp. JC740]MCC9645050.1 glycerol-3-phosphate dehydrogenase/oxidase [Rhodopirellula sp. JC740]
MHRDTNRQRVEQRTEPWDIVVIGGGATGVAIAMDAASRGLDCLLLEQADFGKGTSSRSTKLVHGGVRYLQQGNITLVRDALRERTLLRSNAPQLVHDMPFLIPCRSTWERLYYSTGLKVYDFLATGNRFGRSHAVSESETLQRVPTIQREKTSGGVIYHDGQFDDTRLLISMARTADEQGACLLNYFGVTSLLKNNAGEISGVVAIDSETNTEHTIHAHRVVNAAGPFCDAVREMDEPQAEKMLAASQGVHIVLPRRFFPGDIAMIVPKTSDGRVLFIIPWHNHAVVGTTDTAIDEVSLEPRPQSQEIEFLLATAKEYLVESPTREDVLSVFTGIRPLVKGDKSSRTASLSRDHTIRISDSGLITITGGKWTTVRKMAEDCVDKTLSSTKGSAIATQPKPCQTETLRLHGYDANSGSKNTVAGSGRGHYGSDLRELKQLEAEKPEWSQPMTKELSITPGEVIWAVRHEMARTVEDVLARRTRCLFLNTAASKRIAPAVAELIRHELQLDETWVQQQVTAFEELSKAYEIPIE